MSSEDETYKRLQRQPLAQVQLGAAAAYNDAVRSGLGPIGARAKVNTDYFPTVGWTADEYFAAIESHPSIPCQKNHLT